MFEFLKEKIAGVSSRRRQSSIPPDETGTDRETLRQNIIEAIKTVYDPEIPVNVYDLGLIYSIAIDSDLQVSIQTTLTAPS